MQEFILFLIWTGICVVAGMEEGKKKYLADLEEENIFIAEISKKVCEDLKK